MGVPHRSKAVEEARGWCYSLAQVGLHWELDGMPVSHHVVVDAHEVQIALQAILTSETFIRSQQLSRLLKYLCDFSLAHGADRISEYAIGTEALGRPQDFDPTQDAAVRVEMH